MSWTQRASALGALVDEFSPDWVSWQLVPYGLHPKGILPPGSLELISAGRGARHHVMLHELWLGLARHDPFRYMLTGTLQRRALLTFLSRLRPASLHTTNAAYQMALARSGWLADVLPLFGNIPIQPSDATAARLEFTRIFGASSARDGELLAVIFGTIHPQWQPEPTLAWLEQAAAHAERRVNLLLIGQPGAHGAKLIARLGREHGSIRLFPAGSQSSETISRLLQLADFGIATHPWALLDKSGTTATLLEHGLPVLAPRDDWHPRRGELYLSREYRVQRMADLAPESLGVWLRNRTMPESRLPGIATLFLSQLESPAPLGALVA